MNIYHIAPTPWSIAPVLSHLGRLWKVNTAHQLLFFHCNVSPARAVSREPVLPSSSMALQHAGCHMGRRGYPDVTPAAPLCSTLLEKLCWQACPTTMSSPLACVLNLPVMFPATTKKVNDIFNAERAQFCEALNALAPIQTHLKMGLQ